MSAQILIVDDSPVLRSSIRSSIEQNTDWQVCGEAENGQVAIEKTRELHPDLIILDLAMPIMNGLDAARQIAGFDPGVDIVLFTMHGSRELSKYAELIGIKQVLSKSSGGIDQLLSTVRVLLDQKHSSLPPPSPSDVQDDPDGRTESPAIS
jgi:two-component system chemotaxis response regulator CheY